MFSVLLYLFCSFCQLSLVYITWEVTTLSRIRSAWYVYLTQLVNSYESRLAYTLLDIKGFLQFISLKKIFFWHIFYLETNFIFT